MAGNLQPVGSGYSGALFASQKVTTPANVSQYQGFGAMHFHMNAAKGGAYNYNGSSGVKTNYYPLLTTMQRSTVGESTGYLNRTACYAPEDCLGNDILITSYSGYLAPGDEQTMGLPIEVLQGLAIAGRFQYGILFEDAETGRYPQYFMLAAADPEKHTVFTSVAVNSASLNLFQTLNSNAVTHDFGYSRAAGAGNDDHWYLGPLTITADGKIIETRGDLILATSDTNRNVLLRPNGTGVVDANTLIVSSQTQQGRTASLLAYGSAGSGSTTGANAVMTGYNSAYPAGYGATGNNGIVFLTNNAYYAGNGTDTFKRGRTVSIPPCLGLT